MGIQISDRNKYLNFIHINRSVKDDFSLAQSCDLKSFQKVSRSLNLAFSVIFVALQVG